MKKVYERVDVLNDLWKQVEAHLKGIEVVEDGLDLAIQRCGSSIRITYKGVPISDCKTEVKSAAADLLPNLIAARQKAYDNLSNSVECAITKLNSFLRTGTDK